MAFETTIYQLIIMFTGEPHNDLEQFAIYFMALIFSIVLILELFEVLIVIANVVRR